MCVKNATFILPDPGHPKQDKPRGKEIKTRRSKNGHSKERIETSLDINPRKLLI